MIMRKTLCVCLVLVLCLFATGYAEEASVNVRELFGTIENGAYENKLLGLGFDVVGWHGYNKQAQMKAEEITFSEDLIEELKKTGGVTLLEIKAEDGSGNININVGDYGNVASIIEIIGLADFLQMSEDSYKETYSKIGIENLELEYAKTSIEDQEYDGLRISGDLDGEHMNVRQMMFIRGNYMLTIVVMAPEETMVEDILGRFYCLKDSEE